jgi:REP element-mobilizing transposase RayT
VLSRGNEGGAIFLTRGDYQKFLDLVAAMVSRFKVEVHAYVLMKNHYHVLIRTQQANLSRAIQWLGVSYAGWFNREHKRSGHLFQGRFKSFLIENDLYLTALCYYIHGNPLRAGIVKDLWEYEWSSYHGYADKRYQVSWLNTEVVLGMSGGRRRKFISEQGAYLKQNIELLEDLRHGLYLGSEDFAEECKERLRGEDKREKPQVRSLLKSRDINSCALEILGQIGVDEPERVLKTRRGFRNPKRDITIYVMSQFGTYTNKEIGKLFGVGYTTITEAVKRGEELLKGDKKLNKLVSGHAENY